MKTPTPREQVIALLACSVNGATFDDLRENMIGEICPDHLEILLGNLKRNGEIRISEGRWWLADSAVVADVSERDSYDPISRQIYQLKLRAKYLRKLQRTYSEKIDDLQSQLQDIQRTLDEAARRQAAAAGQSGAVAAG